MKVAIVHDWLITYGGAERVLEEILKEYPQADLFALYDFLPAEKRGFILNKPVTTSFLQKFPWAKKKYRSYLPLMPLAVEQFDLSAYDLVISSSHAVAKGVITGPYQLHICMCYSPIRYAWDLTHQYLKESGLDRSLKGWVVKYFLHKMRMWDYRTANGVDQFIAISNYISQRILKFYRREATVIYPPVKVNDLELCLEKEDYYLTVSRMVPYKKIGLIVEAFAKMPDKKLVVIGDGPEFEKVKSKVASNVELLGYQPTSVLKKYMQKAKAFVFAAEEDFGILPVEAQACGTPVIAYGKGGVLETVINNKTGLFFYRQEVDDIIEAVNRFENMVPFDPEYIRQNALKFSVDRFHEHFKSFMADAIKKHHQNNYQEYKPSPSNLKFTKTHPTKSTDFEKVLSVK
ncbi:MAG: glycosyltransferase family 4 protein [FCB group bacterium]|nr:glycosyltransferase family 4 protein [FCB group bacterium]